jgi:hypothetical protein
MQLRPSDLLGILRVRLALPLRTDLAAGQGHGLEHPFAPESRLMVWLLLAGPFSNRLSGLATDLLASVHVNLTSIQPRLCRLYGATDATESITSEASGGIRQNREVDAGGLSSAAHVVDHNPARAARLW